MFVAAGSTVTFISSMLTQASAVGNGALGGAIYQQAGMLHLMSTLIANSSVVGPGSGGGGLFIYGTSGTNITSSKFLYLSVLSGNGDNSAGGMLFLAAGSLTISNSFIQFCSVTGPNAAGGALMVTGGLLTVFSTRISRSSSLGPQAAGGAVFVTGISAVIFNTTIEYGMSIGDASAGGAVPAPFARAPRRALAALPLCCRSRGPPLLGLRGDPSLRGSAPCEEASSGRMTPPIHCSRARHRRRRLPTPQPQ